MMISCGITFVVISGNLDLSAGSILSLLMCISLNFQSNSTMLAILIPLPIALIIGIMNGFIVGRYNANSVVVTLAMMLIIDGIGLIYTKGSVIRGISDTSYSYLSQKQIFSIPIYVFIVLLLIFGCGFLLIKTTFGKYLYYLGVNKEAAEIAGIKQQIVITIAYIISSISAFTGSIILGSRLLAASSTSGKGYEFDALTAILVGGTKLSGGKGNIFNTILGVILISIVINGLTLFNIPYEYQNVAKGLLVFIAILTDVKAGGNHEK
jgi:ribose/xylose/arabinose/galactoside ABC-type transport system permease subunit